MGNLKVKVGVLALTLLLPVSRAALAQNFVAMNYSPFHKKVAGQWQAPGDPIPPQQIINDLTVIWDASFNVIKIYGDDAASNLNQVVPLVAAHFPNMKVFQGVYEDATYNSGGTTTYLDTAIALANQYPNTVAAIIVGNECLTGDTTNPTDISPQQLEDDIQYVKDRLKNGSPVLVSTDFSYGGASNYGAQLANSNSLDFAMVNIYPFYAGPGQTGVPIGQALTNLEGQSGPGGYGYSYFIWLFSPSNPSYTLDSALKVMIGETGWPSAGPDYGQSDPSVQNEQTYTQDIQDNIDQLGPTFLFQAYDTPWLQAQNAYGRYWGLWTTSRAPKFPLAKKKKGKSAA